MITGEDSKIAVEEENKINTEGVEAIEIIDFDKLYEDTIKNFLPGEIVKGTVIAIWEREALIDIGYKSEGVLELNELDDPASLKIGDELDVLFERLDDKEGMVVVSKRKADRQRCWNEIIENATEGSIVDGRIFKRVSGGFMVDVGMEAFLPASLVDIKATKNLDQFIGLKSKFKIVKINPKRKNIVVSRKDWLESEKDNMREKRMKDIQVGAKIEGRVKNLTDFGAFLDLGGVDGLLHITDIDWGRINHPSEVLSIGDEITVMITTFDEKTQRISLGLKQLKADPWIGVAGKYPVDSKVKGKVVNILPYGAFVELEKGVEGLVHVSELSWTKRISHPSEFLAIGDEVEAVVLSMDPDARKIALGIKQVSNNPWVGVEDRYKAGDIVKGEVQNTTDYGAFVELEPGLGGLIHISDLSWAKRINHPDEVLKRGDEITVKILTLDNQSKKISLGIKQLEQDPWQDLAKTFEVGAQVKGKVTKMVGFGFFVEITEGIEGLVHVSEIPEADRVDFAEKYKPGQELEVSLLRIDGDNRKIALSIKAAE